MTAPSKDIREDIRFDPTDGLTYNPNEVKFWERSEIDKELTRTFELCHSCRMCFKFCQSFPTLFDAVDTHGDVRDIPETRREQVVSECFQCKLCYTQCPYTEGEKHEYRIDFPRLMQRMKAWLRREKGTSLRDRLLADPDRLGRMTRPSSGIANWANRWAPFRGILEKIIGIHRRKILPSFHRQTFEAWYRKEHHGAIESETGQHDVVLFSTCYVNYNRPDLGQAACRVLDLNDCKTACPKLNCCGMPALDSGDIDLARAKAKTNVETLHPYVERGFEIAVINPTCSLMMKSEYPDLLDDPRDRVLAQKARAVASATRDISEFLFALRRAGHFNEAFQSTPQSAIAYHAPCHLRMQNIGFRGRDLMRRIPETKLKLVQECSGHDGTWAMKKEFFELSLKNGEKAFSAMEEAAADLWVSDCPLSALHFEQAKGRTVHHPIEILDRAYREDGFAHRLKPTDEETED